MVVSRSAPRLLVLACLCVGWMTASALASAQSAQTPPAPGAAQTSAGTASLAGKVVRKEDPATAIPRARVVLTADMLTAPRVAITGADGAFSIEGLPAGEYSVAATASGYAPLALTERRTDRAPTVALADAQKLTGLEIELAAAGVIAGQVLDEDGRAFVGAAVSALVSRTENNRVSLLTFATSTSDDRGEFRLTGLTAGEYFVSAADPAFERVSDTSGPLRYVPTFYPGVVFLGEATRVLVTPGAEPQKIVIKLKIVRPANVKGLLETPDDRLLISGMVIMSPVMGEALASIPSDDAELMPDGSFMFRNVPPGLYQIRARAEIDVQDVALFATYRIRVEGRDVSNIRMALRPGASVSGKVIHDARNTPRPPTPTGLRVRAPLIDGSNFGDALTGDVQSDATFRVRGLIAGTHYVSVEGLTPPWIVKQILWRGKDITDIPVHVESREEIDSVRITLTDVASEITGTVRDGRARPVADALIAVIPVAAQFWTRTSRRFGLTVSDASGKYRLRGLPAGEYRIVASAELDESEVYRGDLVRKLSAQGQPVSLTDHQAVAVDLRLTSIFRATTR